MWQKKANKGNSDLTSQHTAPTDYLKLMREQKNQRRSLESIRKDLKSGFY